MMDHDCYGGSVMAAIPKEYIETRDRTASKFIEKHQGTFTQQSIRPLQGNGMAAISKNETNSKG